MPSLREQRVERLFSVRALAKRAGVAPTTVHLIENGRRGPQYLTIQKICQALGVTANEVDEFREALRFAAKPRTYHGEKGP